MKDVSYQVSVSGRAFYCYNDMNQIGHLFLLQYEMLRVSKSYDNTKEIIILHEKLSGISVWMKSIGDRDLDWI